MEGFYASQKFGWNVCFPQVKVKRLLRGEFIEFSNTPQSLVDEFLWLNRTSGFSQAAISE